MMRSADPTAASTEGAPHAADIRYFVGGVQRHITQQELKRYFSDFGNVIAVTLKHDALGNFRGYGWVIFRGPPQRLERQEPHVLKGVTLTVEKARDRPSRPPPPPPYRQPRRRSRSRSRSPSASSSSASSTGSQYSRRVTHRRGEPRYGRGAGGGDVRTRLPPLTAPPAVPAGAPYTMSPPPPPPPHSTRSTREVPQQAYTLFAPENRNSNINNSGSSMDLAVAATETYLCIPVVLCPPEYLNDPRTFYAKLDQGRLGSLNIVPTPLASASAAPTTILRIPSNPSASTSSSANLQAHLGSMGSKDTGSNKSCQLSRGPIPTAHAGMHQNVLN